MSPSWETSEYWKALRPEEPPSWPEKDPEPEVTNRDPRPADAPADPLAVRQLVAQCREEGLPVLVGYSRGPVRAQKTGTYTRKEHIGVWSHALNGFRFCARYERAVGGKTWAWHITLWRVDGKPVAGRSSPVRFTWCTITDLKEFLAVRGSVIPSWFKDIHAREEEKAEKQKAAQKTRAKAKREGAS